LGSKRSGRLAAARPTAISSRSRVSRYACRTKGAWLDEATRNGPKGSLPVDAPSEPRGPGRNAVRAGRVRSAFGLLGLCAAWFVPSLGVDAWAFGAYLAISLICQWIIQRRLFRSVTRAVVMGFLDTAFLSFFVQRSGSLSSPLPLLYVVTPVLYATTTPRRRISMIIAVAGTASYATIVLLEQLGLVAYAPASAIARPESGMAVGCVLLVALSTAVTAGLSSQLIWALGQANVRLRDLSQHDELTGLYNRRYAVQRLEDELARSQRNPASATFAMVDLDGFKRVNDEQGHDAGDTVLKAVAAALLSATRRADVVARYGGDEFVILFPGTELEGTLAVGARMLELVREAARQACPAIPVSASMGTTGLRPADDATEVVRRVDEQLYAAKRAGGDRVCTG
jgi:diguanylate cyclase (GGDEF)-like protein